MRQFSVMSSGKRVPFEVLRYVEKKGTRYAGDLSNVGHTYLLLRLQKPFSTGRYMVFVAGHVMMMEGG